MWPGSLTLAPGGNAYNDSRLEELVIKIADLEAEEHELLKESSAVSAELAAFFSGLDDPNQMKILIMKYIDLKTVEEIRKELDRSERFVQLKHRFGIMEAKKLYSAEKPS